ncbi:hypothetical protein [Halobacteriovorax sp. HLS]|uniref:hypothetical protein n=1 Tax=Halobacteriovorax sp. HLS TaxID=2234000 RepID=UPI000FD78947|nr:hypothetical protein [Halobacteriovorax sp. HLS]
MKLLQFILLFSLFSSSVFAIGQFKHFKITDAAKLESLYGQNTISNKGFSDLDLADDNPLYREILTELGQTYDQIGLRQSNAVINGNDVSVFGGLNNVGIRYSKSFVDFSINLGRTVAPDLFSDKWIVTDEFTISIDASKLLSNLKEEGTIDFTEAQYAAFAGVSFKRLYRTVHFANSYTEGLTLHFDRLFLGFMKFHNKDYLNLGHYEFIQKEDYLSFKAGGIAGAPIYGPITGSIGVLASYEKLSRVDVEAIHPDERSSDEEKIRISFEKTKSASVGVSASIGAEFLKLLQVTLLKYDFTYKLEESKKTYLSFFESDFEKLKSDSYYASQVERILKGKKADLMALKKNIVSHELRKTQQKNSKYAVLLWGGQKEAKTQQIEISKDGKVKRFFRHYYEKIKFKQNVFSRLMSILVKSFLKLDSVVNKDSSDSKKIVIEYSSQEDLVASKEDIDTSEEEKISMAFTHNFYTYKTDGKRRAKHKKAALDILYKYSGVDPLAITLFEQGHIIGPVSIKSDYKVNRDGIDFFLKHSPSQLEGLYRQMCSAKSKSKFSWFRNLFNSCLRKMKVSSKRFYKEWELDDFSASSYQKCKRISRKYRFFKRSRMRRACMEKLAKRELNRDLKIVPLWRFKDLAQTIYLEHKNKIDIFNFYGTRNVFHYGHFKANRTDSIPFVSYFDEGNFSGLGVVDNYRSSNNLRSPSSVGVDRN